MSERIICQTVAELIAALSTLPPDTRVMCTEPPFDHIAVVPSGSGKVLLCTDGDRWRAFVAKHNSPVRAA